MDHSLPIPGPLSLGDLLDRTFRLYRARFRPLLLTSAALLVPSTLLTGVLTTVSSQRFAASPTADYGQTLLTQLAYLTSVFLLLLVGLVFQGLAYLALTRHTTAALHGDALPFAEGLRYALSRFFSWLGMTLLQGLAFVGSLLVAIIPLMILGVLLAVASNGELSWVSNTAAVLGVVCGYALGILLILIPVAYLAARWVASLPAMVVENLGGRAALGRSWRLTKGRVWRSIGYVVLLGVMGTLIMTLPQLVVQMILTSLLPRDTMLVQSIISSAVSAVLGAFWFPITLIAWVLYYYDLRARAEGYDLALRVDMLAAEVGTSTGDPEAT